MYCRDLHGNGVYPYQMQIVDTIFDKEENIPLKFGTAKVGNVLRPFVYFTRPKAVMDLKTFVSNNPILGQIQDNFNMQQRVQNQYELIFDMHELTKNYETKGKETWPYIDYICAVIKLFGHLCLSANTKAIQAVQETGLDESHVLCCIAPDNERLIIHEKFKQIYMFLTKNMYILNDPISPGIVMKNRCYVWDKLVEPDKTIKQEDIELYNENSQEDLHPIENDLYAGKAVKKLT